MQSAVVSLRKGQDREGLVQLAKFLRMYFSGEFSMVEVGCYAGEGTAIFSKYAKRVSAVDPWRSGYDAADIALHCYMSAVEKEFDKNTASYPNVNKLKMTSLEAVNLFEDHSLDFVYIDAIHTYEAVKSDINAWLPKVKKSGLIGGHDYCRMMLSFGKFTGWEGSGQAVDEILSRPNMIFVDHSWIKVIDTIPLYMRLKMLIIQFMYQVKNIYFIVKRSIKYKRNKYTK